MGLSIHYSGVIKDINQVDDLVKEVTNICQTFNWSYDIIESTKDPIRGICFGPEGCEPLFLTFLPDGKICSLLSFIFKEKYPDQPFEPIYTISTKTQYAGIEAHKAIIKLFKYLKEKYFSSFELMDEGYYWETNDPDKLQSQFDNYNAILDFMEKALNSLPRIPSESTHELSERIEKLFKGTSIDIKTIDLDNEENQSQSSK